jgi:hypothetical protein
MSLRDRLAQARRENFVDLRVTTPAFEGLFVRCRALTPAELTAALNRHSGKDEAGIAAAVDALVATCIGIWEESDGKGVSPVERFSGVIDLDTMEMTGDLPTFSSPELAEALGLDEQSAEANVRALLAPNSALRLVSYSDALGDFSTGANTEVLRAARGN